MRPAVIFDLDQTLLDTSSLEHHRKARDWTTTISKIPTLKPFDGINEILNFLTLNNIAIIIITKSPGHYCSAMVNYFKWKITGQICYHDVRPNIKPHPAAFFKAINEYNLNVNKTISVGDSDIDIIASNAAKIHSIACPWASPDSSALLAAKPTYLAQNPAELFDIIKKFFNLESH